MNQTNIDQQILFFIKFLLFLAPLSLIIVCPGFICPFNLFFPYITGKAIFFRLIIEIALLLMVLFLINNKQYLPKKNEYLFWVSIIFLIAIFIINLFSLRPYLSFWGNAERSEGVWGLLHFLIWFWLLWIIFKIDPDFKKTIFYSFLITLYIISFVEIYQGLKMGQIRPSSTLGNATYVGFFANLMIFICLYFLYKSSNQEKIFIFLGILLSIISILISQTRGAILGISTGIFVFALYYFLRSKIKVQFKLLGLLFIVLILFGFYQFLLTDYALKIPGINRVAESIKSKEPYMPRLIAWQIFLDAWKQKPLLGYGLENSPIAYFKAFKPEIFNYEEVIFDRPHNKYIEILVTNGIIGAFFWFLLYIFIFLTILKNEKNIYLQSTLLGFFVGYLVQNFTLFDIQASYLPLFFGLALLSPIPINHKKEKIDDKHILPIQVLIGGLVVLGVIINIYNFYIVRSIIIGLTNPIFPRGLDVFESLAQRKSQFLPEIALMANRYLESNLDKINSFEPIGKSLSIYSEAFKLDRYDTRLFNSIQITLLRILNAKKNMNLDYSQEKQYLDELFNMYLKEYPRLFEIKIQYVEYLKIIGKNEEAYNFLKQLEEESFKNRRYAYMYLYSLYNFSLNDAYEYYLKIKNLNYSPKNQFDYMVVLRITKEKNKALFENLRSDYLKKFNTDEDKMLLESQIKLDK
ncbi:MAG: hypothetical protein KatS3mg095_0179 [Candidatus Parcubacteria bacterium]|nr:MAG: hypothetical protein KatS3mg095_0179 [Candidatus Parcubacteria bacterium]